MRHFRIKPEIKDRKNEKGFSLIEIMIFVLVLAVAFGGLINLMMNFSVKNVFAQNRRAAAVAAQELMEEIKSKKFDQLTSQSASGWSVIGIDTGETAGNKATFNDVDDYDGWSENLASPFAGFVRTAAVTYVSAAALNTASASRLNDYKKITVQVLNGNVTYAQLETVVSAAVPQS